MADLDATDDGVDRFVVWHYKYDEERRERRNVVVAAFDTEAEFLADIERRASDLRQRKAAGTAEQVESIGGTYLPVGSAARARDGRTAWKAAMARGRRDASG